MYGYNLILCNGFFDLYKFCEKNVLKLNFGTVHRLIKTKTHRRLQKFQNIPTVLSAHHNLHLPRDDTRLQPVRPKTPSSSGQAELLTTDTKVAHLAPDQTIHRNWLPGPSAVASLEQAERAFNSPLSCHCVKLMASSTSAFQSPWLGDHLKSLSS